MVEIKRTCDRCGKQYSLNKGYIFHGPKSDGIVTGFTFLAMRTYVVHCKDLCDDCISDLIKWYYGPDQLDPSSKIEARRTKDHE